MKLNLLGALALIALAQPSFAAKQLIVGSSTLEGVVADAIDQAKLSTALSYEGNGSGNGETALVAGTQGIAPMSRPMKADAVAKLPAGVKAVEHVIGLDGIGVFVNSGNKVMSMDLDTVRGIFTCTITDWKDVRGSTVSGSISAYVRDAKSGTTDSFKALTGIKDFGACVKGNFESGDDIATRTASEPNAIGYAGNSAERASQNHAVDIASARGGLGVRLTEANVRAGTYPLSRKLFVYSVDGARKPSVEEQKLLAFLTDVTVMARILQKHDMYTAK